MEQCAYATLPIPTCNASTTGRSAINGTKLRETSSAGSTRLSRTRTPESRDAWHARPPKKLFKTSASVVDARSQFCYNRRILEANRERTTRMMHHYAISALFLCLCDLAGTTTHTAQECSLPYAWDRHSRFLKQ